MKSRSRKLLFRKEVVRNRRLVPFRDVLHLTAHRLCQTRSKFSQNTLEWGTHLPTNQVALVPGGCVKTVSEPLRFQALEICLSEKQTPQVIVFSTSRQKKKSL